MRLTKITPGSNMRWESSRIMLPEHVARLRQLKEDQKKIEKHELDEQELQEIGYIVLDALNQNFTVRINYWAEWTYHEIVGSITKIDYQLKQLKIVQSNGEVKYILIDCIRAAEKV